MDDLHWTVSADEDVGARADVVLGRRVPGLSRRAARQMAREGKLRINGRVAPASSRVASGDELRLTVVPSRNESPIDVEILRVTPAFVYVHKPAMMHVHRLRPDDPTTVADLVARIHPECAAASPDVREGGVVHRLDLETSGVVAFARNVEAWSRARDAFRCGSVRKFYLAICGPPEHPAPSPAFIERVESGRPLGLGGAGNPAAAGVRITAPLQRTERGVKVDRAGVPAETLVWVLSVSTESTGEKRKLCLLSLVTGRRHQARVHLAWLGCPIVGDTAYGGVSRANEGFLLHAWGLDLAAVRPEESAVWAPVSGPFSAALAALGIRPPEPLDRD